MGLAMGRLITMSKLPCIKSCSLVRSWSACVWWWLLSVRRVGSVLANELRNQIHAPCISRALQRFNTKPTLATIKMFSGCVMSRSFLLSVSDPFNLACRRFLHIPLCIKMNFWIDCNAVLTPSTNRKTPLKNAPSIWTRCHPKDSLLGGVWVLSVNYIYVKCSQHSNMIWSKRLYTSKATSAITNPMRSLS